MVRSYSVTHPDLSGVGGEILHNNGISPDLWLLGVAMQFGGKLLSLESMMDHITIWAKGKFRHAPSWHSGEEVRASGVERLGKYKGFFHPR